MPTEDNDRRLIALTGFMGAGKTAIGRRLALHLAMPFTDADAEIERAFGRSVAEIFSRYGEGAFRTAERRTITSLLSGGARVLSLGGGSYCDPETRALLRGAATTIWLDPPFELILERLEGSRRRPLLLGKSREELHDLWKERRPAYAEADVHVVTSASGPDHAVRHIIAALP